MAAPLMCITEDDLASSFDAHREPPPAHLCSVMAALVRLLSYPAAMPLTTRRPNCPTCGDPVHLTHHCRGRRRVDPPEPDRDPPPPATIRMLIRQARDEARLAANPPEQLTMELDQ